MKLAMIACMLVLLVAANDEAKLYAQNPGDARYCVDPATVVVNCADADAVGHRNLLQAGAPTPTKPPTVGELIQQAQDRAKGSSPAPGPAVEVVNGSSPAPIPNPAPTNATPDATNATPNATKTNGAGSMAAVSMAQWTLAALVLALGYMA